VLIGYSCRVIIVVIEILLIYKRGMMKKRLYYALLVVLLFLFIEVVLLSLIELVFGGVEAPLCYLYKLSANWYWLLGSCGVLLLFSFLFPLLFEKVEKGKLLSKLSGQRRKYLYNSLIMAFLAVFFLASRQVILSPRHLHTLSETWHVYLVFWCAMFLLSFFAICPAIEEEKEKKRRKKEQQEAKSSA